MKSKLLVFLFTMLVAMLVTIPIFAQDEAEPELSALAAKTQALEANYSVGIGALFTNGGKDVNQLQAPFFTAHLHGFDIPNIPLALDVATGAIIEIGKETLNPTLGDVNVRVWSTERLRVGNVVAGADLKVIDTGDYEFDARVVTGYVFNLNFSAEMYLFEDQRPISAVLFYRF